MGHRSRALKALIAGLIWAAITLAFCGFVVLLAGRLVPARSQSLEEGRAWIHQYGRDCCPHFRCFPVEATPGMTHWIVWGYRSDVRLGRERRWPFEGVWGCAYPHEPRTIRCLFIHPQEQS